MDLCLAFTCAGKLPVQSWYQDLLISMANSHVAMQTKSLLLVMATSSAVYIYGPCLSCNGVQMTSIRNTKTLKWPRVIQHSSFAVLYENYCRHSLNTALAQFCYDSQLPHK